VLRNTSSDVAAAVATMKQVLQPGVGLLGGPGLLLS
jgi:hypothetical protein